MAGLIYNSSNLSALIIALFGGSALRSRPAPFGYTSSFLKSRIPNHESIVVNAAKSGGQEEMLKRRAYCSNQLG
jgi:hypothetical protein